MTRIFISLLFVFSAFGVMAEEEQEGLLPPSLLERLGVSEVVEYACRQNYRCEVGCSAGQAQESLERQNVHRMELAMREELLVVAVVYTDAVGKPHQSTAILPRPASCLVDNLVVKSVTPLVEGDLIKPPDDSEIIFDMQPDNDS